MATISRQFKNGIVVQLRRGTDSKAFTVHTSDNLITVKEALIDFFTHKYKDKN